MARRNERAERRKVAEAETRLDDLYAKQRDWKGPTNSQGYITLTAQIKAARRKLEDLRGY